MNKKEFYNILNSIVGEERLCNEEIYIINDYISTLEQELNKKNKIIEELSNKLNDYIKEYEPEKWEDMCRNKEILEELEKGSEE